MPRKRPTTIPEYIRAAPRVSQPHLRRLYTVLKRVAPRAEETIKWGNPFFVEPRFLFAFSAHKAHVSFAPTAAVLAAHRRALAKYDTTRNFLKLRYDERFPEALVRKLAKRRVSDLRARGGKSFW